ncbi:MAG: hypothetical protein JST50_10575 [Bacteroidetes bacterium]|jgi:hypothetical protein|nr:hypothetical protein [Bacteroidota bacterium]
MPNNFNLKQKSLTRRFLLILGVVTLIACVTFGLMIMFYQPLIDQLDMSKTERIALGGLLLLYSVLRFSRLFKKDPVDEE